MSEIAARLTHLCSVAEDRLSPDRAAELRQLAGRLKGPLRIAIAGRVKAGKSTLLNALVGERLAPTDAGECTRIVTWYRRDDSYGVRARYVDGTMADLPFERAEGTLHIDLGDGDPATIEHIDVRWPSANLDRITLIDTPGLASLDDQNSARTVEFLASGDGEGPTDADAVVYLMRHIHRQDVEFLDAFMDRTVAQASPANAIGVLSRADEIGGGRLDALDSARRIAKRYREDESVKTLCSTVIPVAGLLAEGGATLRQDEYRDLALIAAEDDPTLNALLITSDRFRMAGIGPLTSEKRTHLLGRFGLFGVRFAVDQIRSGAAADAPAMARSMVHASGVGELRRLLVDHFLPRARVLQGRAVLVALRALAGELDVGDARWLSDEIEQIESTTGELAELRLLHLAIAGAAGFSDAETEEVRALLLPGEPAVRLGLHGAEPDALRNAVIAAVERWRLRSSDPRNDPIEVEACELVAQTYERLYVLVDARESSDATHHPARNEA
jgi:hypothetical protein